MCTKPNGGSRCLAVLRAKLAVQEERVSTNVTYKQKEPNVTIHLYLYLAAYWPID